jgi:hypothetical protein
MNLITKIFTISSMLTVTNVAVAQTPLQNCKLIKTDSDRLKCFDQISTADPQKNKWQITDDRDPIDDGKRITAILRDETGNARFEIACKQFVDGKNFLLVTVTLPQFQMSGPGANVVYRINSEPAIEGERWGKLPNSLGTLWILEPYPFFKRLKENDSLFIRASDLASDFRVQDARFNLADFSNIQATLASSCPEPHPKPSVIAPSPVAKPKARSPEKQRLPPVSAPLKLN